MKNEIETIYRAISQAIGLGLEKRLDLRLSVASLENKKDELVESTIETAFRMGRRNDMILFEDIRGIGINLYQ